MASEDYHSLSDLATHELKIYVNQVLHFICFLWVDFQCRLKLIISRNSNLQLPSILKNDKL